METKVCVVCNIEKSIDNFYNKDRECKQCNIKRSTRRYFENKDKISNQHKLYYEKNRDILLARSKIYQQNRKSHTQQIKDLNNKTEELTEVMETLFQKLNRFIRICKWHSLTTYFVKSVIDSIQKNDGINISIQVDIYIEKSMDIDQHFFHKEN